MIGSSRLRSRVARGVVTSLVGLGLGIAAVAYMALVVGLYPP